jgi:hypothetical protein
MSDWVNLNIDTESLKVVKELEDGVKVIVSPSPYDVPGAIKAEFDRSKSQLRILFRYIGTEPLKRHSASRGLSFGVGKNSGRLYEITLDEINIQNAEIPELVTRIGQAIDRLKGRESEERKENYRLAKRALNLGQVPLFLALNPNTIKGAA